jgi:thiol-disulfide isomerase/thioredoxin
LASKSGKRRKEKVAKKSSSGRIVFAASIVIIVVVIVYVFAGPATGNPADVGGTPPNFNLPVVTAEGLTSRTIELSSLRGRVVVLEFMVSWCKVCRAMAPSLVTLSDEYEQSGVFFLSVAGTMGGASAESTTQFIKEYSEPWTHVLDTDNSVFTSYHIEATPTYFIIDKDGKILSKFQGLVSTEAFQTAIDIALSG